MTPRKPAKLPAKMWATVTPDGYVEAAYALRPGRLNPDARKAGWRRQRVLVMAVETGATKPVRCYAIVNAKGKPVGVWLGAPNSYTIRTGARVIPGRFVPDAKKGRKRG